MTIAASTLTVQSIDLADGLRLEYVERGQALGLPVVLLHGVTDSWRSFEALLPHLPESVRAIAVSQRGHGDSSRPPSGYRIRDLAGDVRLLMDVLSIPRAVVVGHSMGSLVGQCVAIDHPDRILGLVLLGSAPTLRAAVTDLWHSVVSTMTDPIDPVLVREFQLSTVARPTPSGLIDTAVQESLKVPARVWRATFEAQIEADFTGELHRISASTLIVWGTEDSIALRNDQAALQAGIRASRLVAYPGGGHAVHWEDPAGVAADLSTFFNSL